MKVLGADGFGETGDVPRSLDISLQPKVRISVQVVDRGEMKEVINLVFQRCRILIRNAEARFQEVTRDGNRALCALFPKFAKLFEPLRRRVAHQEVNGGCITSQQRADQPFADEAAGSRDEINHVAPP